VSSPRPINPRELISILQKLGFTKIRQKGSHIFFRHPNGRCTVVPFHKGEDISRGLLRKILSDIDLTPAEFNKLR